MLVKRTPAVDASASFVRPDPPGHDAVLDAVELDLQPSAASRAT